MIERCRFYRTPNGNALATGAFVQALEYASGKPAIVAGKPTADFYASALGELEWPAAYEAVCHRAGIYM